jgi:hypothetical protein
MSGSRTPGGATPAKTKMAHKAVTAVCDEQDTIEVNSYFKVMGYLHRNRKTRYCIYSYPDHKVYIYSPQNCSHGGLRRLAPIDAFWIPRFPGPKGRLNRLAVMDAMFRLAERRGSCDGFTDEQSGDAQ